MLGAIIGDIAGSRWEFNPTNNYDFEMFSAKNSFTDDSVCTIAVADAILRKRGFAETMHEWCRRYPHPMGGYGGRFAQWVGSNSPKPYSSFGNGSAMRVSAVGWAYKDRESVLAAAEASAACTHNHPEGIKGAQTVALAIHLGLRLRDKYAGRSITRKAIREEMIAECARFSGYDVNLHREDVMNKFEESCQGTVPVALAIIAGSHSFEDAIRNAVSLGADADTLGAIVGSIAETVWPIPEEMRQKAISYLPDEMRKVLFAFKKYVGPITPRFGKESEERAHMKAVMFWKLNLGNLNKPLFEGKSPLPSKETVATIDMLHEPVLMPKDGDDVSHIPVDIPVSAAEMKILRRGHIAETQEDHWFMVCDDEHIRYFRSWTGMCVFEAHYHRHASGDFRIDHLDVHHALAEFCVNGDVPSVCLFRYLIEAEVGGDSQSAWEAYEDEWEALDFKQICMKKAEK